MEKVMETEKTLISVEHTLILTQKEAFWLRNYLQNPRHLLIEAVECEEDETDREMRREIFESLEQVTYTR
jgi:hypothetical protein